MYLALKSHAKINLTLEVLYRRADGYHEIKTILQELELHDTIYLQEISADRIELFCDDPTLPREEGNLAYQAAQLLRALFAPQRGVRIRLFKKIPVAAGLGGGSSNAAAVLKGLNRLWNLFLPAATLGDLGAKLGSDVPFFLYGGTALATGRGELIHPLPSLHGAKVLLCLPEGMKLSAAEVYRSLDLQKKIPATTVQGSTDALAALLQEQKAPDQDFFTAQLKLLHNDLEEAVFKLQEGVALLKEKLKQKGLAALVSGSGPAVFALARDLKSLQEAGKNLSLDGFRVILTETVNEKKDIIACTEENAREGDV